MIEARGPGSGGMEERSSNLLLCACAAGSLLGIVATAYFLLGTAGHLRNLPLNLLVAAVAAAGWLFLFTSLSLLWRNTGRVGRAASIIVLGIIAIEILLSLVPPTARDELTHHLALPRLYARAGRIIEVPIAPYSYYPMLLDMLYVPWVHWGYDSVPKLIHGLFGFLTGLAVAAYLWRRMNVVYGLLGFILFISIPAVLRLGHWAYVDLAVTFFSTASLLCLLRWRENREVTRWLALAAASAGFAAATKPNGLLAASILSVLFLVAVAQGRGRSPGHVAAPLLLFAAFAAAPVLPWLIKNWLQTSNPFFPHLTGFFPTGGAGTGTAAASFSGLSIFAKRELLYGETWWQIAALPVRLFFSGRDDDPRYFDGVLSPGLVLLLPWAFKGKWRDEKIILAGFAAVYLAFALSLADLRVRYVLPIVPPLAILAVYGVFNVYLGIRRPAFLFAGLIALAALHGSYLWRYYQDAAPLAYVTGRESRDSYLRGALPEYPAFQYINHELPPAAKIYLLFIGRRAYYCDRDYFHDAGELPGFLLTAIRSATQPSDIRRTLEGKSITHLMIREDLLRRFLTDNLRPAEQARWNAFAGAELRAHFRHAGYAVYELHG